MKCFRSAFLRHAAVRRCTSFTTYSLGVPTLVEAVSRSEVLNALEQPLAVSSSALPDDAASPPLMADLRNRGPSAFNAAVFDFNSLESAMSADNMASMCQMVAPHAEGLKCLVLSIDQVSQNVAPRLIAEVGGAVEELVIEVGAGFQRADGSNVAELLGLIAARCSSLKSLRFRCGDALKEADLVAMTSLLMELRGQLKEFTFEQVPIDTECGEEVGQAFLTAAASLTELRVLSLAGCPLLDAVVAHRFLATIADGAAAHLEELDISMTYLGDTAAQVFASSLQDGSKWTKLRKLNLRAAGLSSYGVTKICDGIAAGRPPLQELILDANDIDTDAMVSVCNAMTNIGGTLHSVSLQHCRVGYKSCDSFAEALSSTTSLRQLLLRSTYVGDLGMKPILSSTPRSSLEVLALSRSRITNESLRRVGKFLPGCSSLQELHLNNNNLRVTIPKREQTSTDGESEETHRAVNLQFADGPFLKPFVKGLVSVGKTLRVLNLNDTGLTEFSLRYFLESGSTDANALSRAPPLMDDSPIRKLTALRELHVAGLAVVSPSGRQQLLSLLNGLPTGLESLTLASIPFGDDEEDAAKLAETLSRFKSLKRLDLSAMRLGDEFLTAFATHALPVLKELEQLQLAGNTLLGESTDARDAIVLALEDGPALSPLRQLTLFETALGAEAQQRLLKAAPLRCEIVAGDASASGAAAAGGAVVQ